MAAKGRVVVVKGAVDVPDVLTGEQVEVLAHLVSGSSQRDAAAAVGVAEETISRWMHGDPLFVATLNGIRAEVWRAAVDRLRGLVGAALVTVEELMAKGESESTRLRAASLVLKSVHDLGEPQGETDPERLARLWTSSPWDLRW